MSSDERQEDRETQKEGGLPWREEGRLETPELGRQEGPSPLEPPEGARPRDTDTLISDSQPPEL